MKSKPKPKRKKVTKQYSVKHLKKPESKQKAEDNKKEISGVVASLLTSAETREANTKADSTVELFDFEEPTKQNGIIVTDDDFNLVAVPETKKDPKLKRGILIIACGHPYYGRMAFNLIVSIRHLDKLIPIQLAFAGSALSHIEGMYDLSKYVNYLTPIPEEYHTFGENKEAWIKVKTRMYKLSLFEKTLFFDSDMMWLPRHTPNSLFEELKKVSYTIANRDFVDLSDGKDHSGYSLWCDVDKMKKAYGLNKGRYYSLHSEVVYFVKNKKNEKFFNLVAEVYDNCKVEGKEFGGAIPDELAFAIATAILEHNPHKTPWLVSYWAQAEKGKAHLPYEQFVSKYMLYSIGGNKNSDAVKGHYNRLARYYFQKAGLAEAWQMKNKTRFLRERAEI